MASSQTSDRITALANAATLVLTNISISALVKGEPDNRFWRRRMVNLPYQKNPDLLA